MTEDYRAIYKARFGIEFGEEYDIYTTVST